MKCMNELKNLYSLHSCLKRTAYCARDRDALLIHDTITLLTHAESQEQV
jgi:hypothetical protein